MRKGRRQKLNGSEVDLIYCKKWYNWSPGITKWLKRNMSRRFRKDQKKEITKQLNE